MFFEEKAWKLIQNWKFCPRCLVWWGLQRFSNNSCLVSKIVVYLYSPLVFMHLHDFTTSSACALQASSRPTRRAATESAAKRRRAVIQSDSDESGKQVALSLFHGCLHLSCAKQNKRNAFAGKGYCTRHRSDWCFPLDNMPRSARSCSLILKFFHTRFLN